MRSKKSKKQARPFDDLLEVVTNKLRPPFGTILGSPGDVAELAHRLPPGETICYQMDLYQADRLVAALHLRNRVATVETLPDLWDLPGGVQTLIYPVAYGGERELKLDMIEQAWHALKPHGSLIVLSPYDHDDFFPRALKKVFGRVHAPMEGENAVFWCQRDGDRPRRRHEMNYHVRVDDETSYSFDSRPGVFGYGFFDEGARALTEAMELQAGQRVLDLGCGVGTLGILAARQLGPTGFIAFADSNVRAVALAEQNARTIGVPAWEARATHTITEWPDASFDVVLANPPYYAQGAIIRLFIERARALLRPGGVLFLVTKQVDLTWPVVQEQFGEPELFECRGYVIFRVAKG
jgi:16S rRNA (guanine1207-N2)-methyltransferase